MDSKKFEQKTMQSPPGKYTFRLSQLVFDRLFPTLLELHQNLFNNNSICFEIYRATNESRILEVGTVLTKMNLCELKRVLILT